MWNAIILFERKGKQVYCNHFCFAWGLTLYSLSILTRFESSFLISRIYTFVQGQIIETEKKEINKEEHKKRNRTVYISTQSPNMYTHKNIETYAHPDITTVHSEWKHRCSSKCNKTEMRTYAYDVKSRCTVGKKRKENKEKNKTEISFRKMHTWYIFSSIDHVRLQFTILLISNSDTSIESRNLFCPSPLTELVRYRYIVKSKYEENK